MRAAASKLGQLLLEQGRRLFWLLLAFWRWIAQEVAWLIRNAGSAMASTRLQTFLFAIVVALVGITFTVRATYVSSFRSFDMEALGYLVSSAENGPSSFNERLLACFNLVASENMRDAESLFTLVALLFTLSAVLLGIQGAVMMASEQMPALRRRLRLLFPYILPRTITPLAIAVAIIGALLVSGQLWGFRIISFPEPVGVQR